LSERRAGEGILDESAGGEGSDGADGGLYYFVGGGREE